MVALNPADMTALWTIKASETPITLLLGALLDPQEDFKAHRTNSATSQDSINLSFVDKRRSSAVKGISYIIRAN